MKKSHATKCMDRHIKVLRFIGFLLIAAILLTAPVFAGQPANYGENAGRWVLDQIFWIALIATVIVLVKLLLARNFIAMLISGVACAIALVIIREPQQLETIGKTIWSLVSGG